MATRQTAHVHPEHVLDGSLDITLGGDRPGLPDRPYLANGRKP